jgi:hypothetical protein
LEPEVVQELAHLLPRAARVVVALAGDEEPLEPARQRGRGGVVRVKLGGEPDGVRRHVGGRWVRRLRGRGIEGVKRRWAAAAAVRGGYCGGGGELLLVRYDCVR